jgi:hypothetical protein
MKRRRALRRVVVRQTLTDSGLVSRPRGPQMRTRDGSLIGHGVSELRDDSERRRRAVLALSVELGAPRPATALPDPGAAGTDRARPRRPAGGWDHSPGPGEADRSAQRFGPDPRAGASCSRSRATDREEAGGQTWTCRWCHPWRVAPGSDSFVGFPARQHRRSAANQHTRSARGRYGPPPSGPAGLGSGPAPGVPRRSQRCRSVRSVSGLGSPRPRAGPSRSTPDRAVLVDPPGPVRWRGAGGPPVASGFVEARRCPQYRGAWCCRGAWCRHHI